MNSQLRWFLIAFVDFTFSSFPHLTTDTGNYSKVTFDFLPPKKTLNLTKDKRMKRKVAKKSTAHNLKDNLKRFNAIRPV